jgi:hypothetical protein
VSVVLRARAVIGSLVTALAACGGTSGPVDAMNDAALRDATGDAGDADDADDADAAVVDVVDAAHDVPDAFASALLLNGGSGMPCADPAVFSATNAGGTFYVYCTSVAHVWRTSDWVSFTDVRHTTSYDLTGMSANGRVQHSWWAPGILYDPDLRAYVMWVSVPAANAVNGGGGWDTREIAVLVASSPTGPWVFRNIALPATARGEHYLDPFPFRDHDGQHYVVWKQFGSGLSASIMAASVNASWTAPTGTRVQLVPGFGGAGTWELNVRENPALWHAPDTNEYHLLFAGAHWQNDSYGTGHALSTCGLLCTSSRGGWHIASSGDRGVVQVVQASGDPHFSRGGPGGAMFGDDAAQTIVYAAAARSASHDGSRYLMRDRLAWRNSAPYVDTPGHRPEGL